MADLVVVIAYSSTPAAFERASFEQCLSILGSHDVCVVCPESMAFTEYAAIAAKYSVKIRLERFDDQWFTSVASYNRLMLSPLFYKRFRDVRFILLYQLDAWVFEDQFDHWCSAGYDYVGAPWFTNRGEMLPFAGNGGFTLRRVDACLSALCGGGGVQWDYSSFFVDVPARNAFFRRAKQGTHFLELALCRIFPEYYFKFYRGHEDFAFVKAMSAQLRYTVAPPETAMLFSFERFPGLLFQCTGGRLPFGAHALARYDPEFWSRWLPSHLLLKGSSTLTVELRL